MPSRWIRSRPDLAAFGLLLLAWLGAIGLAHAQDAAAVKEAQQHYRRGEAAFNAQRFEDAIKEWEAGYALVPRPLFVLNLGHAERRRGELRKALALYRRFLVVDPETKLRAEVEQVIQEIEVALAAEAAAQAAPAAPVSPPPLAPPAAPPPAAAPNEALSAPAAPAPPDERARPGRLWLWAAAGVVVAGVALGVWALSSRDGYERRGSLGTLGGP
jgi:tetratricopeptide (TPR) repeat protein